MADVSDTEEHSEQLPPFVVEADRQRWENAGKVASDVLGPDAPPEAVWSTRRVIFHDRENYPD